MRHKYTVFRLISEQCHQGTMNFDLDKVYQGEKYSEEY